MPHVITRSLLVHLAVALAFFLSGRPGISQGLIHLHHGGATDAQMGDAVASASDVDMDGATDYLIGIPGHKVAGTTEGRVDLHSGRTSELLASFDGQPWRGAVGTVFAAGGDINSDGTPDFILGTGLDTAVISGATNQVLYLLGEGNPWGDLGDATAIAGDLDNDGFADFVTSSVGFHTSTFDAGRVAAFSGQDGSLLHTAEGDETTLRLGWAIEGIGDITGDGCDDYFVGAPGTSVYGSVPGKALVYSGATGTRLREFVHPAVDVHYGSALAALGDVDDDGHRDAAIGARGNQPGASHTGSVFIVSLIDGREITRIDGDDQNDLFGWSVAGLGDVNDDLIEDICIGAPSDDGIGPNSGELSIRCALTGVEHFAIGGEEGNDWLGKSVAPLADMNNNGLVDLVSGAPGDYRSFQGEGSARVDSLICGSTTPYGTGCAGSGSHLPSLTLDGCPTPGGRLRIGIRQTQGGQPVALLVGPGAASIPVGLSCTLLVWPVTNVYSLAVSGSGPGQGWIDLETALPTTASVGSFFVQLVAPLGAGMGLAFSNGVAVEIE